MGKNLPRLHQQGESNETRNLESKQVAGCVWWTHHLLLSMSEAISVATQTEAATERYYFLGKINSPLNHLIDP